MRYSMEFFDSVASSTKSKSHNPQHLILWIDHSYDHAIHRGLRIAVGLLRGFTTLDITADAAGRTILSIEKRSMRPWEEVTDLLLKTIQQQLDIESDDLEEIENRPYAIVP